MSVLMVILYPLDDDALLKSGRFFRQLFSNTVGHSSFIDRINSICSFKQIDSSPSCLPLDHADKWPNENAFYYYYCLIVDCCSTA